jgi:PhzF family phenazine biosynthesis protein
MKIKLFQVDAFTDHLFGGNPAAVCPLDAWLADSVLQNIAMENNLSETAFFTRTGTDYSIRWFTPAAEVELCGHATLAAAHVIFKHLDYKGDQIDFQSKSGVLSVSRKGELLILDFPSDNPVKIEPPARIIDALSSRPLDAYKGRTDYLFVFANEEEVASIQPDFRKLSVEGVRGIMVTAPGKSVDFVSRFFAPGVGIDEDPVTGSAHTTLIPYWSKRLGKTEMNAIQASKRGGVLSCKFLGKRVEIGGKAVTYLEGSINI